MLPSRCVALRCGLLVLALACGAFTCSASTKVSAAEPKPQGKRIALLVGVNKYEKRGFRDLEFAEQDVSELSSVLQGSGYTVHLLVGKQATLATIRETIRTTTADLTKSDLVLVGLAGHGFQLDVGDGNGRSHADSFYCPFDAVRGDADTMLAMGDLFEAIDKRGGGQNIVLVDACREDPTRGRGLDGATVRTLPLGMAVLFGCQSGQKSYESPKAGKGHGVFFHFVIEGLRGAAKNERDEITWSRLAEYVVEQVETEAPALIGETNVRQTPNMVTNLPGRSPVLVSAALVGGADSYFQRGEALRSKDPDKAIELYNVAIRMKPFDAAYFNSRAIAYNSKSDYDTAIRDYTEAIKLDPGVAVYYWNRASNWFAKGEHDRAIADYNTGLELRPGTASGLWGRARSEFRLGDYRMSLEDSLAAFKADPEHSAAAELAGMSYWKLSDFDRAIEFCGKALTIDANLSESHNIRGLAFDGKGDREQAIAAYGAAIKLSPASVTYYTNRADSYLNTRNYELGIADCAKALEIESTSTSAYVTRARLWAAKGEPQFAIDDCNAAIKLNPASADAYFVRGLTRVNNHVFDSGVNDLLTVLRLSPDYAAAYSHLAWVRATCPVDEYRDGSAAVKLATKACELTKYKSADIVDTLAAACAEAGYFDHAIGWEKQAIKLSRSESDRASYRTRLGYFQEHTAVRSK